MAPDGSTPDSNIELSEYKKEDTLHHLYLSQYQKIVTEKYADNTVIFTDGSKSVAGLGSASISVNISKEASLPHLTSVFSSEVYAIHLALQIIAEQKSRTFLILSDSLSTLKSLQDKRSDHPMVRKLQHRFHYMLHNGNSIQLMWIPSHVGISENEEVDELAKRAAKQ